MTDIEAAQDVIRRYHQAHADHDADALRACHADAYFRWYGNGSDDPQDWTPGAYCTSDYMMEWGKNEDVNTSTYDSNVRFLSTKTNEELAVLVTEDSGRWTKADGTLLSEWQETTVVWFLAKLSDTWKITGYYWRDGTG